MGRAGFAVALGSGEFEPDGLGGGERRGDLLRAAEGRSVFGERERERVRGRSERRAGASSRARILEGS